MKQFRQLFSVLIMLLTLSVGNVWAADPTVELNFKTLQVTSGTTNGVSWETGKTGSATATACNSTNGLVLYGVSSGGGYFQTTSATSGAITNIYIESTAKKNTPKYTIYCSSNGSDWTEIESNISAGTKNKAISGSYTYVKIANTTAATAQLAVTSIIITYSSGGSEQTNACATPTFNPDGGNFVGSTSVTLSSTTDGATIYYTTNGSDPTTSSSQYSTAINISQTTTIKAIAVKNGMTNSEVASKTFTKVTPYTTIDAIFNAASATSTPVYITFNNWVVSGVKNNNAYVTDGEKGFIIYQSSHGFVVGDVLSGTVSCNLVTYYGSAELTGLTSTTTGLTVTKNGTITPVVLDDSGINALTGVNTGSVIKISGECTTSNSKYYIAGVQLYNSLFGYQTPNTGVNYNCTGVYIQYNNTKEICPRSAADLEEIVKQNAPEAPVFNPLEGVYTEAKSVTITCETDDAVIYYTIDGTTPSASSTQYTTPVAIGETTTLKAIAIKNNVSSTITSATYTINLPENEEESKTWDLSIDETATASADALTWTATYVSMAVEKSSATTNANNYYPGKEGQSYTSTRMYKNSVLTITPAGKQITSIVFTATTENYATALQSSTWTNASASVNNAVVTVTPIDGESAVSVTIGATTGFTQIKVYYEAVVEKSAAEFAFPQNAYEANLGDGFEAPVLTYATGFDGTVVYSSSDEAVATVAANGAITILTAGTTIITATSAATDNFKAGQASYTLTVNDPNAIVVTFTAGTDKSETTSISKSGISISFSNGAMSRDDDYRCYADATMTISSEVGNITKLEVTCTASGTANYGPGKFSADGYNYSGNVGTWEGEAESVELTASAQVRMTQIAVTYASNGNTPKQPAGISYTTTAYSITVGDVFTAPTISNPNNLTITYEGNNDELATVNAETGALTLQDGATGSITVTATAASNDNFLSGTASYTLTVNAPIVVFAGRFEKYSGDLIEGDYMMVYDGKAMNSIVSGDRLQYMEVAEAEENVINNPSNAVVWHIAQSGDYWTMYNEAAEAYAASTGAKNKAQMLADGTDDKALWTVSGTETYEFVNKANAAAEANANLRNNGTYGFACYATTTGGELTLYKKAVRTLSYNLNGGSGSIAPQTVGYGTIVTLADKPVRDGYYFMGWKDAGNNMHQAGAELTVTADITLTAQWEELGLYSRDIAADKVGKFGTICLANPVYEGCIENAEVYKVVSFSSSADGLLLEQVNAMEAGMPYFFISNATTIKFRHSKAHTAAVAGNENGLYGTINGTTVSGEGYYVLQNNALKQAYNVSTSSNINISLAANRAYLNINEVPDFGAADPSQAAGVRCRVIGMEQGTNTATGCDELLGSEAQVTKVLRNGVLYIIRADRTYNVQGQLVK